MITLAGSVDASVAALQGLRQATASAGRSIAAMSSGEMPAPAAAPSSGGAVPPVTAGTPSAGAPVDSAVGSRLNAVA